MEELPMTETDLHFLKMRRNRQLILIIPPYLALLCVGLFVWFSGPDSLAGNHEDEEDIQMFWKLAPYVVGFFIFMATIYFAKQFAQSIYPLIRDINTGKKLMIYFTPAKNKMAYFNRYYLSTPLFSNQQIEVSSGDFEMIADSALLCLETGPKSQIVLRLCEGVKEIKYF
jgi:hypothetical protein